jgi:hypothetical protein
MIQSGRGHAPKPNLNVPLFWPMLAAAQLAEYGAELYAKNLKFLEEEIKISQSGVPSRPPRTG